jgi:hypothetical protein
VKASKDFPASLPAVVAERVTVMSYPEQYLEDIPPGQYAFKELYAAMLVWLDGTGPAPTGSDLSRVVWDMENGGTVTTAYDPALDDVVITVLMP